MMSELDKAIVVDVFQIDNNINTDYIIFIVTDTCDIKINNPDIRLVIQ